MNPAERELLAPLLDDLRAGVRPFTEQSIGICAGIKTCDRYLGREVGELAPGDYMVRAELAVPDVGERGTWKVRFDVSCTITRKVGDDTRTSTHDHSKEYTVFYAGEERGYRLQPLYRIHSPAPGGARACTYTLTAPHPSGEAKVWSGSWKVPASP